MAVSELERGIEFDLRGSWQARVLGEAKGLTGAVALSVLAHSFDEAMPVLLAIVFPGFKSIVAPFLCTAGKVDKSGAVVADMVTKTGTIMKDAMLYPNETKLRDDFRQLADRLKLNDPDRIELFKCVQRWVVADRRLDPTFDPMDPDARRLLN